MPQLCCVIALPYPRPRDVRSNEHTSIGFKYLGFSPLNLSYTWDLLVSTDSFYRGASMPGEHEREEAGSLGITTSLTVHIWGRRSYGEGAQVLAAEVTLAARC